MSLVPVIIPYYKAAEKLEKCLAHIKAQTHPCVEVFVRDNSEDNIYFTAAVNEGLKKFAFRDDVKYVLILNQDAYLAPDAIEQLVLFMDRDLGCGIACPIQVNPDGSVSWGGSLDAFPDGMHKVGDISKFTQAYECYWANGACMMVRTALIHEVGVFDKNMRFICSDSDFSFSARARDWRIHIVPAALCQHSPGAAVDARDDAVELVKLADVQYLSNKWLNGNLYRSLAFEGPQLTRAVVDKYDALLKSNIEKLAAKIKLAARA